MEIGVLLITSSVLITFILLAVLIALSFKLTEMPQDAEKVSRDLKKIKKQVEEPEKE